MQGEIKTISKQCCSTT